MSKKTSKQEEEQWNYEATIPPKEREQTTQDLLIEIIKRLERIENKFCEYEL